MWAAMNPSRKRSRGEQINARNFRDFLTPLSVFTLLNDYRPASSHPAEIMEELDS